MFVVFQSDIVWISRNANFQGEHSSFNEVDCTSLAH